MDVRSQYYPKGLIAPSDNCRRTRASASHVYLASTSSRPPQEEEFPKRELKIPQNLVSFFLDVKSLPGSLCAHCIFYERVVILAHRRWLYCRRLVCTRL